MIETTGDIWRPETWNLELGSIETLWLCITTNGYIKKNGCASMGNGVAKQARDRFDGLSRLLGEKLKQNGNRTQHLKKLNSFSLLVEDAHLWTFPTKMNWEEPSTIERLSKSACQLKFLWELASHITPDKNPPLVALPRPGCGNGKLNWKMVKPVIAPILDNDNFIILKPAYIK